ncbi:hypothetical protein FKM82_006623 [Ascaphus truei]
MFSHATFESTFLMTLYSTPMYINCPYFVIGFVNISLFAYYSILEFGYYCCFLPVHTLTYLYSVLRIYKPLIGCLVFFISSLGFDILPEDPFNTDVL